MLDFPRAPHGDQGRDDFLGIAPISAFSKRIRVTFENDKRGGARRMCRREQRPRRERPGAHEQDPFATLEIVEHSGDAVGPLLQRRQRTARDGAGRSRAWLVEEDESTE